MSKPIGTSCPKGPFRRVWNRRRLAFAIGVAPLLLAPGRGDAKLWRGARLPAEYRVWKIESPSGKDQTVSQLYVPLITTWDLGPGRSLVLSTEAASSDSSQSLNGLSDVTVRLYQRLSGDRLVLTGGVQLPSGKKQLTEEELRVVQALNHPLRGFRLKQYGAGLDASFGMAYQIPLRSGTTGGLGASFAYRGKYALLDVGPEYQPGFELTVSTGLEAARRDRPGSNRSARLGLTWHLFGSDESDGRRVFEEGDQIDLEGQVRLESERIQCHASTLLLLKASNTSYSETLTKLKTSSGSGISSHGGLRTHLGRSLYGGLEGELRRFSGSDMAGRDGHAFGIGPSLSAALGNHYATFCAMYLWGVEEAGDGDDRRTHGVSMALSLGLRAD